MLVLARKEKESILIGDNIEIIIQSIDKDSVKIAIVAPKEVKVFRKELVESVKEENKQAIITIDRASLVNLLKQRGDHHEK